MMNNEIPKWKRAAAMAGVILLLAMVIATVICAICHAPGNVIFALLFCDIIVPIFLWVFLRVTGHYKEKGEENND